MEEPSHGSSRGPQVRATLRLGNLSEQLISMKVSILKEFITKHNVPNDVPDELVESSSEEDTKTPEKTHVMAPPLC
ncbi:hypothetical protein I3843_12G019600 [Carya illinoinensis]|nr:hypothetical protein I3843_12G019600 [Carya illinoinensis]